jgi:hypothetical protein
MRPVRQRSEHGGAASIALFAIAGLALFMASTSFVAQSDILATRNYRGNMQVQFVAESAIAQALQTINGPGVRNFQAEVDQSWEQIYGRTPRTFPPLPGFTYVVEPWTDPADPANSGRLIATATGPEQVTTRVVAAVTSGATPFSPGAIYLATNAATNSSFSGDRFLVDGNDRNRDNSAGPERPVPGIATRMDGNTQETRNSLSAGQINNVLGVGFSSSPPIPSVWTSPAAPSVDQINALIASLIAMPSCQRHTDNRITANLTLGTPAAPQCNYYTSSDTLDIRGTVQGAGIMIVDGNLSVSGDLEFEGLVLVKGNFEITGSALMYGSVWTENVSLDVLGRGTIYYSSQALRIADMIGGGNLFAPLQILSMANCSQVEAGTSGC